MIAVAAAGVCRRYGRRWALADVSFEVPAGALVMVTGRNGSGKSTLLRVLATAIRPDLGTARILGQDRKSTRLNSSHSQISYAVFCLKKKKKNTRSYYQKIKRSGAS